MDLNLQIKERADDALVASYSCPCGCNPRIAYKRGDDAAVDGCCCGNTFAIGADASDRLSLAAGFNLEAQVVSAPWGESLQAAWAIGPSTDPNAADAHDHGNGHEHGASPTSAVDPVCGMTVDIAGAVEKGLHSQHSEQDFYFCGRGCKLEFGDDPEKYLDPAYVPSM